MVCFCYWHVSNGICFQRLRILYQRRFSNSQRCCGHMVSRVQSLSHAHWRRYLWLQGPGYCLDNGTSTHVRNTWECQTAGSGGRSCVELKCLNFFKLISNVKKGQANWAFFDRKKHNKNRTRRNTCDCHLSWQVNLTFFKSHALNRYTNLVHWHDQQKTGFWPFTNTISSICDI